jgi:thymidylate synthase
VSLCVFRAPLHLWLPQKIAFKIYYLRTVVVLKGDTNIDYLKGNGVKIWDDWANENGDLGSGL